MDNIKVLIVDDQIIIRKGIESALKTISFINHIAHACNGKEAIDLLQVKNFDVVLLDIKMPIMSGIDTAKIITSRFPNTKVIAISMYDDQQSVKSMFVNGAKGYLLKDTDQDEIAKAIETVMNGGNYFANAVNDVIIDIITNPKDADDAKIELSEREVFVLKLICEEKTSKEIADKLQVTEKIIHNLRSKLMDKTRSKTSAGLVIFAMKNGIHK
jgi:DNA-binding NarL/FixJ family response regulator